MTFFAGAAIKRRTAGEFWRTQMGLKGQTALVTGSSRGIGRRIAVALARQGADVILSARTLKPGTGDHPGSLHEAAAECEAFGVKTVQLKCDLTSEDEVRRMCGEAME